MVRAFTEDGGYRLFGFDNPTDFRNAQALQNDMTRPSWMAGRIRDTAGLPRTADIQNRLIEAIDSAFNVQLPSGHGPNVVQTAAARGHDAFLSLQRSINAILRHP